VHWVANDYGTILSQIDEPCVAVSVVQPGADSLLHVSRWPKVQKVLQVIDAIEALAIDPTEVAPKHCRHVHNRLCRNGAPNRFSVLVSPQTPWRRRQARCRRACGRPAPAPQHRARLVRATSQKRRLANGALLHEMYGMRREQADAHED
jgi:hypothetical protein